jgi:porin
LSVAAATSGWFLALVAACWGPLAHAQDASPHQGLLGDWGGQRTALYQAGVDFQLSYFNEFGYNTSGGSTELARYADQSVAGVTLDLDKLWGWKKASFQFTLTDRNGKNLSADADLGTLMQVQQVYGRGSIVRLTELYYEQSLLHGALDLKFGRLPVGDDFFPWSCVFMNLSFCGSLPGNMVSTWYNWPVSQWAGRVKVVLAPDWDVKIGIYQINPGFLDNANGLDLGSPAGTIGALVPLELTWSPKLGEAHLPGTYRIGAWYDSSTQPDVFTAANGQPLVLNPGVPPLQHSGESGFYFNVQQQLTRVGNDNSRGLSAFVNFVQGDRNTATIDQIFSLGLLYTGLFPGRPSDVAGFAVGRTQVNPRVADGQNLQNATGAEAPVPVQNAEYPFELFYSFAATRWLTLQPVIQYISRPGGTSANPNATVVGLNLTVSF